MGYIVCEKCGGYYELQPGESPDDFDKCECEGDLKYVQNLNLNRDIKPDTSSDVKVCPACNGKNSETSQICAICGKKLDKLPDSRKTTPNPKFNAQNLKPLTNEYIKLINWKAIATGCIVFVVAFVIDSNIIAVTNSFASDNLIYLESLMGGFAAAYVTGPNYKSGILNGTLSILISIILFLIIIMVSIHNFTDIFLSYIIEGMSTLVPMIISGIIGAFLGTSLKIQRINANKDNETGF